VYESRNAAVLEACRSLVGEPVRRNLERASGELGRSVASLLVEQGHLDRETLLDAVASHLELERCRTIPPELPESAVRIVETSLARQYGFVPLETSGSRLVVAPLDPFDPRLVDDVAFSIGREVIAKVADPEAVGQMLDVYYRPPDQAYKGILEEIDLPGPDEDSLAPEELLSMAGETPIIRFVNLVLSQAIKDKASDIHFEPFENEFKIRYRIDGALYEMSPPPRELAVPIVSRIKVIGNLDIAERRAPQDGKTRLDIEGRSVDLRISTLPTQFGESVVLRVLDQEAVSLDLDRLGMPPDVLAAVRRAIARPNGIFIVTGPTGSGKTTTLYSCIRQLNTIERKIMTAEDPIEYELEGVMQLAVRSSIGLAFADALKAFLRQDPDIIMVGEIRDLETAQIAVQASLTGHLVLSTLHTNDAPGAVTRLMDMGVEPFLIASSLEGAMAQRLLRRVCPECRRSFVPSPALLAQLDIDPALASEKEFYHGRGCERCASTGYRGRLGIFEMLEVSEPVRDLVSQGRPAAAIREQAVQEGMRSLREDALRGVFMGETTIEETLRYT